MYLVSDRVLDSQSATTIVEVVNSLLNSAEDPILTDIVYVVVDKLEMEGKSGLSGSFLAGTGPL